MIFVSDSSLQQAGMVVVAVVAAAAAHDDVVDELDVHHLAGLVHTLGQTVVLHTGIGVVAGMVVGQDNARGQALNGGSKDHLDVGNSHCGASTADAHTLLNLLGMVEQNDHDFLVVEVLHAGAQILIGIIAAGDLETLLEFLLLIAACQFKCSENLDGFDLTDAVVVLDQVFYAFSGYLVEFAVIVAQDALAQVNDRFARRTHPQQDGEQFGSGKTTEAMLFGFLTWAVLLGDGLLDVATRHFGAVFFLLHGYYGYNGELLSFSQINFLVDVTAVLQEDFPDIGLDEAPTVAAQLSETRRHGKGGNLETARLDEGSHPQHSSIEQNGKDEPRFPQ